MIKKISLSRRSSPHFPPGVLPQGWTHPEESKELSPPAIHNAILDFLRLEKKVPFFGTEKFEANPLLVQ